MRLASTLSLFAINSACRYPGNHAGATLALTIIPVSAKAG